MRKIYFLLIGLLITQMAVKAEHVVYNGNISFNNQSILDTFRTRIPYTKINGTVKMSNIRDLTPLLGLEEVTGDIEMKMCGGLTSVVGLDSLRKVGKRLILWTTSIESLEGIGNLTHIGQHFLLYNNRYLTTLDGINPELNIVNTFYIGGNYGNERLEDYCGAMEVINNNRCIIGKNKYNPTATDWRQGKCRPDPYKIPNLIRHQGEEINFQIPLSSFVKNDEESFTYEASNIPDGISFDADTRTFSGVLNEIMDVDITVTATNGDEVRTTMFAIRVIPVGEEIVYSSDSELVFKWQKDIDEFRRYNAYTILDCDLKIWGSNILNLNGLLGIKETKRLTITECKNLKSLKGLDSLQKVMGYGKLEKLGIESFEGLGSLNYLHFAFSVKSNPNLKSLDGLNSPITLGQRMSFGGVAEQLWNPKLSDYCAVGDWLATQEGKVSFLGNLYSPTHEQLVNGQCRPDPTAPYCSGEIEDQATKFDIFLEFDFPYDLFTDVNNDSIYYSVSNLPPGYSFDEATRTISGTSTVIDSFEVMIIATDSITGADSVAFTLNLTKNKPVITYEGNVNLYYQYMIDDFQKDKKYNYIHGDLRISPPYGSANYENCLGLLGLDSISGNLYINSVPDYSGLDSLKKVGGELQILNKSSIDLTNLGLLEQVGSLNLSNASLLASLDGLRPDFKVDGEVTFYYCTALTDMCNLKDLLIEKLKNDECSITHGFYNPTLENLEAGVCSVTADDVIYWGDVVFTTQEQVDTFYTEAHPYTRISGNVTIGGYEISKLDSLQHLKQCAQFRFQSSYSNIKSLKGLDSLRHVERLYITGDSIEDFTAMGNLETVVDYLTITQTRIKDLSDFKKLKSIKGIGLHENKYLVDVSNSIEEIKYRVEIRDNDSLTAIGAFAIDSIESLIIQRNDLLTDYCAFSDVILTATERNIGLNRYNPTVEQLQNGECTQNNHAPTVKTELTDQKAIINVDYYFYIDPNFFDDEDGDIFTYTVTGLPDWATYSAINKTVTGMPNAEGSFTISVTVNDGNEGTVTTSFALNAVKELAGTITIQPKENNGFTYGHWLEADTSALINAEGELTYEWKHGSTIIEGATEKSYQLKADDINQLLKVFVKSSTVPGVVESNWSDRVAKAGQAKPSVPELVSKTDVAVTLKVVNGCEYKVVGTETWQASAVFEGLQPNTEYQFVQRKVETETHKASDMSAPLDVKTDFKTSIDNTSFASAKIYPNPVSQLLYIDLASNSTIDKVRVSDVLGKVQQLASIPNGSNKYTFDFSSYKPGVYIVQLLKNEQVIQSSRIIKNE